MIRTDRWELDPTSVQQVHLLRTVDLYRSLVAGLIGVAFVHWKQVGQATDPVKAMEALMHPTTRRPQVRYDYFQKRFYKFPSYLRRAAIMEAVGQVSSFVTRYSAWQRGDRSRRDAAPPRLTRKCAVWPTLYQGQCIKFNDTFSVAEIKIFDGGDWIWISVPIRSTRTRHLPAGNERLSPALILDGRRAHLSVPFAVPPRSLWPCDVALGVDLGLNTLAVCSAITPRGTVVGRRFLSFSTDIDRRDKSLMQIRSRARNTMGSTGRLSKGFCATHYRKARNRNEDIAQQCSRQIVTFALEQRAAVIVFEHLKGWRPRGGKKRSALRQRFHGWLHRRLVELVQEKFQEVGGRTVFVSPRGTSKFAFDGSGELRRDGGNATLATFGSGKQYNCDLSASYNIAARYWERELRTHRRPWKGIRSVRGRTSPTESRMPITLSSLWTGREGEAPTTLALAS